MAKTINMAKASAPLAGGSLKLSKIINLDKIEDHPKFKELYSIAPELLERIVQSMIANGFDNSQPIHLWITEENGEPHYYLIDGYTRRAAAIKAGLKTIPYFEHKFSTFEEAYKYVLSLQVNRRNLSGDELLRNVSLLLGSDFIQNQEGRTNEAIAETLGVSKATAVRAMSVINNASEEDKEKIKKGEKTVNQVYKELHPPKAKKEAVISEPEPENEEIEISEEITEETRPVEESKSDDKLIKTFSDGFTKALYFCLSEQMKGKSPKEIFESIPDLSPSEVFKFQIPDDAENYINQLY